MTSASGRCSTTWQKRCIPRTARVIDVHDEHGVIELINPEIVSAEGTQCGSEGCLSAPNVWEEVERPNIVTVKAQDRHGKEFTLTGSALLARAFCHELDHLDGHLYVEKVEGELQNMEAEDDEE